MGAFEVICNDITLFSKRALGYFPHTQLLTARIIQFFDDVQKGNDLQKYKYAFSPIKRHPGYEKSPVKTANKMNSGHQEHIIQLHESDDKQHSNKDIKEENKKDIIITNPKIKLEADHQQETKNQVKTDKKEKKNIEKKEQKKEEKKE